MIYILGHSWCTYKLQAIARYIGTGHLQWNKRFRPLKRTRTLNLITSITDYSFQMDLYQEQVIILNFEIFENTGRKTSLIKVDIICVSDRRIMIGKKLKT